MKKTLVIINQHTAKYRLRVDLLELLDILTKGGRECFTHPTQRAGDAMEYTAENAADFDEIVCVGGDGTLGEVVTGLCRVEPDRRPPVGYIPAGTTNDFASSIGLPSDPLAAARLIVEGKPREMDCGIVGGHIFNYIASFGAFTEVSYGTPQPLKNLFGHFAYLLEGVKHLSDIKPCRMRFETGGEVIEGEFAFGAFANTLSIGGVIKLPGEVEFDDGLHEYLLVRMPQSLADLNETAVELAGRNYGKNVVYGKFRSGRIEFDPPAMAWSLDGDRVDTDGAVEIENLHSAYRLITAEKP